MLFNIAMLSDISIAVCLKQNCLTRMDVLITIGVLFTCLCYPTFMLSNILAAGSSSLPTLSNLIQHARQFNLRI